MEALIDEKVRELGAMGVNVKMNDEKEKPDTEARATTHNDEGDKPSTTPTIDAANAAAERMEKANAEEKANLDRREVMIAQEKLGGVAEAGQSQPNALSEEEIASRKRIQEVGKATGAKWADDMDEKKDGT